MKQIKMSDAVYAYIARSIRTRYGNVSIPYGIYLTFREADKHAN